MKQSLTKYDPHKRVGFNNIFDQGKYIDVVEVNINKLPKLGAV